jgi:hypothetical protein
MQVIVQKMKVVVQKNPVELSLSFERYVSNTTPTDAGTPAKQSIQA